MDPGQAKIIGLTRSISDVGADGLTSALKESLVLAVEAGRWGLVAELAGYLEHLSGESREAIQEPQGQRRTVWDHINDDGSFEFEG